MAELQLSARPRAPYSVPRPGVVHVRTRPTKRFTVVGNHLAQHHGLTLTAIGLALHIASLPEGARVDIKTLAARFPEGETRIAAALRELETHGYLCRTRRRLPSGRLITHTTWYDDPSGTHCESPAAPPPPRPSGPTCPPSQTDATEPSLAPRPAQQLTDAPRLSLDRGPALSPLPKPRTTDPARHQVAADLLSRLRKADSRLLLPERDVRRLAPAVAAWLERGATPDAVRLTLTTGLPPEPLRHPAGLLAHRLTELLPPPLPPDPPAPDRPHPFQTCDGCDRAFRSPTPGLCPDCRPRVPGPPQAA